MRPRNRRASPPRRPRLAAACTLAACVAPLSCGARPGSETVGKGVLVIVIDGLREDHVGSSGYDRQTTPHLDELAGEGTTFLQAYTPAPETLPAHAAILTGCEPMLARRMPLSDPVESTLLSTWLVPDELPRLAQEFLELGYATAAFVDHPAISPVYGFGAGFQAFDYYRSEAVVPRAKPGFEDIVSKFFNWLTRQDLSRDWFAYVHVNDLERVWRRPADPKLDTFFEPRAELSFVPPVAEADQVFFAVPRPRWSGATLSVGEYEARYDGALRDLDRNFGRLFEELRRRDRWKNTTIVVVGAYGVGFGESGLYLASGTLSDADLHVPFIVRPAPGLSLPKGAKTNALASLVDVAPTILDLAGIRVPRAMQGISQAARVRGAQAAVPPGSGGKSPPPSPTREIAFAAGGLQAGFTAIDARFCFERSSPAAVQESVWSPLTLSWYGDAADHRGEYRTFLHDRDKRHSAGHLGPSARDAAAEKRLADAGRDYYDWVDRARKVLQGGKAALDALDPATRAELERRRLLGETR